MVGEVELLDDRPGDAPDAMVCEWCGRDVLPLGPNVTGFGFTYPRGESGEVCCTGCRELPLCFVKRGDA